MRRLALAALALYTVWITWEAKRLEGGLRDDSGTAMVGKQAPDFTLSAWNGGKVSLADFRGKNVALVFWASWCEPCRLELPLLRDFYTKARPLRNDFEVLAISIDEYADAAEGAAGSMKLPFPVLLNGEKVSHTYAVVNIPQMLIVDKTGKVAYGQVGFNMSMEAMLAAQFHLDPKLFLKGANGAAGN